MKRRNFLLALPSSGFALGFAKLSLAHHGGDGYDESRPIYLEGKVKSTKWQNPHAEIVVTIAPNLKQPPALATRIPPAQTSLVNGSQILSGAVVPTKRGDWVLELAPMSRIAAWKIVEPKAGDTVAAIGFTYKDEKGEARARIEYLIMGESMYGIRSMPA